MNINGREIDIDLLCEDDKQVLGKFVFVKGKLEANREAQKTLAEEGILVEAAYAHLANAVEDIVQRCTTKGEANDASEAE